MNESACNAILLLRLDAPTHTTHTHLHRSLTHRLVIFDVMHKEICLICASKSYIARKKLLNATSHTRFNVTNYSNSGDGDGDGDGDGTD